MSIHSLSNDFLKLVVDSRGAEIIQLTDSQGRHIIRPKNPEIWGYFAPFLFPHVGRIKNDRFTYQGQTFESKQHGFARLVEHQFVPIKKANQLIFELKSSAQTFKYFPFQFLLRTIYELNGTTLSHRVEITNLEKVNKLQFSCGFHPAFTCPFEIAQNDPNSKELSVTDQASVSSDYYLHFPEKQTQLQVLTKYLDGPNKGLMKVNGEESAAKFVDQEQFIPLYDGIFKEDSICFTGVEARAIYLRQNFTADRLCFEFDDVSNLLIWSPNTEQLEFICLEPWHGLPDYENASEEWTAKKHAVSLESGEKFTTSYQVSWEPAVE